MDSIEVEEYTLNQRQEVLSDVPAFWIRAAFFYLARYWLSAKFTSNWAKATEIVIVSELMDAISIFRSSNKASLNNWLS